MTSLSLVCSIPNPRSLLLLGSALLCEPGPWRCHFVNGQFGEKSKTADSNSCKTLFQCQSHWHFLVTLNVFLVNYPIIYNLHSGLVPMEVVFALGLLLLPRPCWGPIKWIGRWWWGYPATSSSRSTHVTSSKEDDPSSLGGSICRHI